MDEPQDKVMTDADSTKGDEFHLPLSKDEERVLELYEKLQELRLEIAIINAQASHRSDQRTDSAEDTKKAQTDLLDARAKYRLRNDAIEAVMMTNPILKAVHNGATASPVERDLLPYVEQRDEAAMAVAKHASETGKMLGDLTDTQSQTTRACRVNVDLTAELLELAAEVKQKKAGYIDNPETQREVRQLEEDVKASRQRWRVMKGVASGVVSGSGVDWARDGELRDIVLDPESED